MKVHTLKLYTCNPPSREIAEFVAAVAVRRRLSSRQAYRLRLATDEITTNIVEHGYLHRPGAIDLTTGYRGGMVWVTIEDDAPAFDPRTHGSAFLTRSDEVGGCGLWLAFHSLDAFSYQHVAGRNRNTLWIRASDVRPWFSRLGRRTR